MPAASLTIPDFTGWVLDERFELLHMLGTGSYGVVYKAVDIQLDETPRAIKVVRKIDQRSHLQDAVRKEVELHSLVSGHPNIVGIHDAFEDEQFFYLVLDLCTGGDLFEQICLKRTYVHNDELLRGAFLAIVDAVQACHQTKIFHRDLKPENILTNDDGSEVYLSDFGLATDRTIVTEFGCGTSCYMSPECIGRMTGGRPYCTRFSDVWSLGVILVNMISGRHPWSKATTEDCCFAQFLEDPNFLREMLPISSAANAVLQRIFMLNPLLRITLDDLRQAILDVDTFFLSEQELAYASEFLQMAAAELRRPQGFGLAAAAIVPPPIEEQDARETIRDPTTPIARQRSFMEPAAYVLQPQKHSAVREVQDCSPEHNLDQAASSSSSDVSSGTSSAASTSDAVPVPSSIVKPVDEAKVIGECVWDRTQQQGILSPVYG